MILEVIMDKSKIFKVILAISAVVLVFSVGVSAEEAITTTSLDDTIVTTQDETTADESHFGEVLKIKKDVNGSSLYAGTDVTIDSNTSGILFVGGNTLKVNGAHEYGFVLGADIDFNSTIENELFVAGSNIIFGKSAKVGRDTYIGGASTEIQGTFGRNVTIYGSVVSIDHAIINGNIKIDATDVTIGSDVTITGTLKLSETATKNISNKATIGSVEYFESEISKQEEVSAFAKVMDILTGLANYLVLFLVTILIFPNLFKAISNKIKGNQFSNYMEYGGIGFVVLFAVPIFAVLSLISVAGLGLGMMTIALYITLLTTSTIITGYVVGETLIPLVIKNIKSPMGLGIFGITIVYFINQIIYINSITGLATLLIALGILFKVIIEQRKQ